MSHNLKIALALIVIPIITFSQKKSSKNFQKITVKIMASKDTFIFGDDIGLTITLTNNDKKIQKVLFDKPKSTTGGPWWTTGNVINLKTRKSVVKYSNKAMLESQVYFEQQLKDKYYFLKYRQSLSKNYHLSDVVVLKTTDYKLLPGTY